MAYEIEDDIMPLFLINGFLEAGKTQFLDFTMQQDYFKTEGKTLLIVCEEGDTEYDEKKLKKNKTAAVFVDDMRKLTPQYLNELEVIYQPERVLMEWNGMWNQDDLKLPEREGEKPEDKEAMISSKSGNKPVVGKSRKKKRGGRAS